MYYSEFKVRTSVFIFLIFSALLLLSSISVWASQEEIAEVENAIESRGAHWVAGETSVSKLSPDERRARLGAEKPILTALDVLALPEVAAVALPTSLDWRNYDGYMFITPVRDQAGCGSCWAFATTAALESYVLITQNTPGANVNLSEQTLVSCGGAGNCSGGSPSAASYYIMNTGLPAETCFPYTATNNSCSNACTGYQSNTYRIHNWHWVTISAPTSSAIKNALYTYGPLVTTMEVYSDFFNYRTGIYTHVSGTDQGGHAILIVGYDDGGGYFVAKNSWGTGWGEAGYFKIAYSELSSVVQFGHYTIAYESPPSSISMASAPAAAWNPTAGKFHVAIRKADNRIYVGTANVDGSVNNDFVQLPTGQTASSPAIAWNPTNGKIQIATKGLATTNLFLANMNADGSGFSGWTMIPAGTAFSPAIAWNPTTNKLQLAVTGPGNRIFVANANYNGTGFTGWTQLPTGTTSVAPAITLSPAGPTGRVQLATRGFNTTGIFVGNVAGDGTGFSGWVQFPAGNTAVAPAVTWNAATSKVEVVSKSQNTNNIFKATVNSNNTGFSSWTQVAGGVSLDVPAAAINPALIQLGVFGRDAGNNVAGYITAP